MADGDAERAELQSLSRRATAPHRMVLRARIVLLAAAAAHPPSRVRFSALRAQPIQHRR
jgi:hypothetical protein